MTTEARSPAREGADKISLRYRIVVQEFLFNPHGIALLLDDRQQPAALNQVRDAIRKNTFHDNTEEMTAFATTLIALVGHRTPQLEDKLGADRVEKARRGAKVLLEAKAVVNWEVIDKPAVTEVYQKIVDEQDERSDNIIAVSEIGKVLIPHLFSDKDTYDQTFGKAWENVLVRLYGLPIQNQVAEKIEELTKWGKKEEPVIGALTRRIVDLHNSGMSNGAIALQLGVGVRTVRDDLSEARRLGVHVKTKGELAQDRQE